MVELWGNALSLVGNIVSLVVQIALCDSFFLRKNRGNLHWFIVAAEILAISVFSIFVGSSYGYTLKILFEVALYYVLCTTLYQSRWDRGLFVIVTTYAVLYSVSFWTNSICMSLLHLSHEEYIWNIPLYSAVFLLRLFALIVVALIIRKYHPPLSVGKQARAWVPLSVVFPLSTLCKLQ